VLIAVSPRCDARIQAAEYLQRPRRETGLSISQPGLP
jgi:hypothetical protein